MINTNYRLYNYFTLGVNEYGQEVASTEPTGKVKLSIALRNQTTLDNILYQDAQYMAFTHDTKVNDTYIIEYGQERLKVLYVSESAHNRPRQIFLTRVG